MGPKIQKKMLLAAWSINNPHWIINQAYNIPLRKIFREVINFDPQEETYKYGKEEMNKRFLEVLEIEKPDYIHLFLVWDEFYPETLLKIKEILPSVRVTHWNGDDDIKFENYTIPYSAVIDYQFISQLQFIEKYDKALLPWFDMLGADTEKFKPLSLEKKYDVVFVGTPKGDRLKYMRFLLEKNVNFKIGGAGWDKYPEFKEHYLGKLSDEEFIRVINEARINLCFSQNFFSVPHVLERSLAVNSCKSFALTEFVEGYFLKFKEGVDFASFKGEEELYEKIQYYLKNESIRDKIANRAFKKVTSFFSNQKLMDKAFRFIERDKRPLQSIRSLAEYNLKVRYLSKEDFKQGAEKLKNMIQGTDYICFKNKGYEPLFGRDYFQARAMKILNKPVSICNSYLNSSLIGDYATLDLHYATKYLPEKSFISANIDISQIMVSRAFFINHFKEIESLYYGKNLGFLALQDIAFLSIPLIRAKKKKPLPLNADHISFWNVDLNLLVLRNQKRLFRSSYFYKLIFYAIFLNWNVLKHLLCEVSNKSNSRIGKFVATISTNLFGN